MVITVSPQCTEGRTNSTQCVVPHTVLKLGEPVLTGHPSVPVIHGLRKLGLTGSAWVDFLEKGLPW